MSRNAKYVCADRYADQDAARLRANPPKVIVFFDLPESEMTALERQFREGRESGQRRLAEVTRSLLGRYVAVGGFRLHGNEGILTVWVRADAARSAPH